MSEITPDEITLNGLVEYESAEAVLDTLSKLKELDTLDEFNNQVVDLETEEPVMAFSSHVNEEKINSVTFQSRPSPDQLPEEPPRPGEEIEASEFELNTLLISTNFLYKDRELLYLVIEEVLDIVQAIEVKMFFFIVTLEESFDDLTTISRLNRDAEFDLSGIQFEHDNHRYSFREKGKGTEVYIVYESEETIDDESYDNFIETQIKTITPTIEQICYGG